MANAVEVTKDFPASRERAVLLELLNVMKTLKQAQIDAVICGGWGTVSKRACAPLPDGPQHELGYRSPATRQSARARDD